MMDEVDRFLLSGGYAQTTIELYRRTLLKFLADVEAPEKMSGMDVMRWVQAHGWSNATEYAVLGSIRAYLRWRYGAGHAGAEVRIKRLESPPQRVLSPGEIDRLLASHDTGLPKGRRDLAMCCLLLDTGLRSAELVAAEVRLLDLARRELTVRIKGGRMGKAVYSDYTASTLARWMADRERLAAPGVRTVFVGIGGDTPGCAMTTGGLRAVMRKWARGAGLDALSPHDFRRTFATQAIRAGAPTRVVQVAGRWSSLAMVEHYTRTIEAVDLDGFFPVQRALDS